MHGFSFLLIAIRGFDSALQSALFIVFRRQSFLLTVPALVFHSEANTS